jgi:hypothetical protein
MIKKNFGIFRRNEIVASIEADLDYPLPQAGEQITVMADDGKTELRAKVTAVDEFFSTYDILVPLGAKK